MAYFTIFSTEHMKLGPAQYNAADWLKIRPYKQITPYDNFFILRCRDIQTELKKGFGEWSKENDFGTDDLLRLTSIIGGYFEDFISEVGLWRAFTRYNEQLYGYPVPFYDLTDYDPDYVNTADVAFLIWKYLTDRTDLLMAPDRPMILNTAGVIVEMLEDYIDEAPATGFFETYLTVKPTDHFFVLKDKLGWLSKSSYLLGHEFGSKIAEAAKEAFTPQSIQNGTASHMAYMATEPFLFEKRSSFSALSAADWMAEAAHTTPALKDAIRQTQQGVAGLFRLVDERDKTCYSFQHLQTERVFEVRRDSFLNGKPLPDTRPGKTVVMMNIRPYTNGWHLSGILADVTNQYHRMNDTPRANFWAYSAEKQERMLEMVADHERSFKEFYKTSLVLFNSEAEYQQSTTDWMAYTNEHYAIKDSSRETPERQAEIERKVEAFKRASKAVAEDYGADTDIGLFFCPGIGTMIFTDIRQLAIDPLTAKNPTAKQIRDLYDYLTSSIQLPVATYLLDTYGSANFRFPISMSSIDVVRALPFLQRYYQPQEFGPPTPLITLV
jgi:hypothetical protein